ncbi:MAG: GAF domain-containing sensor histidine kinase [Anaerolineae bacterium]
MTGLNAITLLINAVMLPLALAFLVIILWNDFRKELNQFFAVFLFLVILWNGGSLLAQGLALIDPQSELIKLMIGIMELGFTGSSVAVYVLAAVIVKAHTRRFRALALVSLLVVVFFRLLPILGNAPSAFVTVDAGEFSYHSQPLLVVFYVIFDWGTLYLLWRYRRKVRSRLVEVGVALFVIGQSLGFLNPELQIFSLSINISAVAALVISFAVMGQEIISPLAERNSQVEAIRKVNIAITSHTEIDLLLSQIAMLVASLLGADGVAIFLNGASGIQLAYAHQLPNDPLRMPAVPPNGIAGTATQTRQPVHVDDYAHEWRGVDDFPFARETFGSVVCAPLMHGGEAIGALMAVAAQRHGRLFWNEDVYMLELLGAQAAVAIVHNRLFKEQAELTQQVEIARSQLAAVLDSTQNPVLAVDHRFRLIFANPAAKALFSMQADSIDQPIQQLVPPDALPDDYFGVLRHLRSHPAYTYEISYDERIFLCSLTHLGKTRLRGWVAVLNDVTQLKELDRIKSEMVRMTSHDLKNPLQAAMANLELLQDDLIKVEDSEVWESVQVIDKQLQRMERIIRGILDLERVKSGSLSLEMCHPARIVHNVMYEMRERAVDGHITLMTEVDEALPEFACDVEQFERAIINLVENAIKFTASGGNVTVRARQNNEALMFEVQDTGVGIEKDLQSRVFDRFYRANQKGTEHVSGSGLGLSLVKAVVENHRGKVWLESEPGVGTTFFVSIPIVHVKQEQYD